MSEVISFRLSESNPREAQALNVLNTWLSKGFSVRDIITQALIAYEVSDQQLIKQTSPANLEAVLSKVNQLLERIANSNITENPESLVNHNLSNTFILSVKKAKQPGLKVE